MGKIITGDDLIQQPPDKFWDSPPSRREMQKAFQKMGLNDAELFSMCDTQALVGNFLCEKLGVTREEIEAYVTKKVAELKAQQGQAQQVNDPSVENTLQGQVMDNAIPNS